MDNVYLSGETESRRIDVTRSQAESTQYHLIECTFGKYLVKVQLDELGRFNGISEIRINRDFIERGRNHIHDVDEFYIDNESEKQ